MTPEPDGAAETMDRAADIRARIQEHWDASERGALAEPIPDGEQ